MKLTEQEKRVRIAKHIGWTSKEDDRGFWRAAGPSGKMECDLWLSEHNVWRVGIPDYFHDLNAMHEAWHTLDSKHKRFAFHEQLRRKVLSGGGHASSTEGDVDCCCENATADQRAEAFGLTLGLWREGE